MEGDWLWKPATFKGRTLRCVFFCMSRDFDGAHRSSRWRPVRSRLANRPSFLSFHRKSNNSFFQIWQEKVYWAMLGVNCSVYGCGSCRRTKGIGIFNWCTQKMAWRIARRAKKNQGNRPGFQEANQRWQDLHMREAFWPRGYWNM